MDAGRGTLPAAMRSLADNALATARPELIAGTLVTDAATSQPSVRRIEPRLMDLVVFSFLLAGCGKEVATPPPTSQSTPTTPWFEEVTAQLGLDFIHQTSANGRYLVPEQMGSGAALFDYDNDGRLDIYLIQNGGPDSAARNRLYHQEADGRYVDRSAGSGLDVAGFGMGAASGDVNNDGRTDLLVTEYGAVRLFLNAGEGKFTEVTQASGVENPRWATSAAFFDFDRDGWLDLVIANYLDYDPTLRCTDVQGAPEYCGPHGFRGLATKLFHNLGGLRQAQGGAVRQPEIASSARASDSRVPDGRFDARFEDVTTLSGLARTPGPALGVWCGDFDGDHWPDIFLADDGKPNRLFINQRNGTFREEAALRGVAYNAMGGTAGNMGIAIGDVDGDGLFDMFVTHLREEYHSLWIQKPRGYFRDRIAQTGLIQQDWRGTGFGAVMVDFDLDGAADLAWVNGPVKRASTKEPCAAGVSAYWARYAQRSQLFANDGRGQFREVSGVNAAFCARAIVGRGLACGDIDNDGAVDLLVTSTGGPAQLFRNVARRGGHWLTVRAIEPARGGRDAHGAEVRVQAGGRKWHRWVNPASGYLCSQDPRAHFGLGQIKAIDSIEVLWPDGVLELFTGGAPDRLVVVAKGSGKAAPTPPENEQAR